MVPDGILSHTIAFILPETGHRSTEYTALRNVTYYEIPC
jgi:hypothetical protein